MPHVLSYTFGYYFPVRKAVETYLMLYLMFLSSLYDIA